MATTFDGITPPEDSSKQITEGDSKMNVLVPKYADLLKEKPYAHENVRVPPKPVIMLHGEPSITRKSSEVKSLIIQENLQYEIIGKFSYGKPNVIELKKLEDYVQLLSTTTYYIKAKDMYWQMRTLKWDSRFKPNVETTVGVAWISLPDLPPIFFAKAGIFLIASAVGKPLVVDIDTRNHTRTICKRVKIEVGLVAKLPHRVKINEEDYITGNIKSKWIYIQYDHKLKYCKEFCLQGHDEQSRWNIHPELFD
ncbi:hypothetical protein FXO37_19276 [Capsicum annuum]|nr:hypothetical protein FXO37_19276 [Capsicum annuum]